MTMRNPDDLKLIASYLDGEEKSLEILIRQYIKPIYSFAYGYVGSAQDAEDITQETFVKVWKNLKRFDGRKSFKAWIFSIAKNTAIDFLKKKKSIPFSKFENEEGNNSILETVADPSPLPNELLERGSLGETLAKALQKLLPRYRLVLSLRYNEHLTFCEIAESLGEPIHTVKSRHRRALIMLRKLLGKS